MAKKTIISSTAPVNWGAINRAFKDINDNFGELYQAVSIGLDPESLESSLIPNISNSYDLGNSTNRWKDLYLSGTTLYLGNSTITTNGLGGIVLPTGSTVDGNSINSGPIPRFVTVSVPDQGSIVAVSDSDGLNFAAGVGAFITLGINNTVNFSFDQSVDLYGSVFSNESIPLVDSVNGKLVGPIEVDVTNLTVLGGALGQVLSTDGVGNISFIDQPVLDIGNVDITGSTIDTIDSSDITFTPPVIFQSNVTLENVTLNGDITSTGSGTPEIFSDNEILLTAGTRVEISSSPLKMASFTTVERDLLAAVNGDMIYNTSLNKFQGYANGSWVDFH